MNPKLPVSRKQAYTMVFIALAVFLSISLIIAYFLETMDAENYCSMNANVIEGETVLPDACIEYYRQTHTTLLFI